MPLGEDSYDVVLGAGLLGALPSILQERLSAHHYALIADSNVAATYGPSALEALGGETRCSLFSFPAGEESKSRRTWADLTDQMLDHGLGRDTAVVALGGGVTGDLAGFVAATFMRGVPYVQVPTSLLAMIDSSVGGKTGVDTRHGKNLVGAFHQPRAVVADVTTLDTLPDRELRSGVAEAVKHGAIADADYLDWLQRQHDRILRRNSEILVELVRRSVAIKAGVVAEDERERGPRAILNFGHTVGHALERVTSFELTHGEAVAIGMVVEAALGSYLGITERGTADRLRAAIQTLELPTQPPPGIDPASVVEATVLDKKGRAGAVRLALLESIGKIARDREGAWTHRVDQSAIRSILAHTS